MPFDGNIKPEFSIMTTAEKLLYLAGFMEGLRPEQVDMQYYHHPCGTAHCAWGWAQQIGMVPKGVDHSLAVGGWGLSFPAADYCFGTGYQFHYLNRPCTPADVARHLRETAAKL